MVIVSQRVSRFEERNETADSLDQSIVDLVVRVGRLVVPAPNTLQRAGKLDAWLEQIKPTGIVLSGGNDIGACPERDQTELRLIDYAKDRAIPLLGICRGMQMLGSWAGIKVKPVQHHVRQRHNLIGEIGGEVNSFHNFSLASCPPGFQILARSDDGEIEAIRHLELPWEGWMWHPERETVMREVDLMRMRGLFCE